MLLARVCARILALRFLQPRNIANLLRARVFPDVQYRPLSRFEALSADDGEDDAAAKETGLVGPAAPHQSDDAVSNPEEERRELEERLKSLRLELASELQVPN